MSMVGPLFDSKLYWQGFKFLQLIFKLIEYIEY